MEQTRDTSLPLPKELQIRLVTDVFKAVLDQLLDRFGRVAHRADVFVLLQVHQLRVEQGVLDECACQAEGRQCVAPCF